MKIPTPNSSVRDIGKVVFKSKNTYFDLVQNGTREMIDLWMYNYARNIPDILDGVADICGGLTGAYLRKYL